MKVIDFDIAQGCYGFELDGLSTGRHGHPAMELIISLEGHFDLTVNENTYPQLAFALINPNLKHELKANDCRLQLWLIERVQVEELGNELGLKTENGLYTSIHPEAALFEAAKSSGILAGQKKQYDPRIQHCLDYIANNDVDYHSMIDRLKNEVHLSESRLSHLFRQEVGISLKRYQVWHKLKLTINMVLEKEVSLFAAALENGFYDQAHFSKAFKDMLGISPSEGYNSSTLQV